MDSSDDGAPTNASDTIPNAPPRGSAPQLVLPGYAVGAVLGKGGMGEVVLAHDEEIGRDVAIKRMHAASPSEDALARFMREAKIQARLEHPAIVPVHELGYDSDGLPYFTMKRLSGTTLYDALEYADQRFLLRAFVDVCLAVEFAHNRGVVHRDIKPQNIMLGDYGEVYVLDWGLARVAGDSETAATEDIVSLDGQTQAGAMLGTPGYMAPEQMRGEVIGAPVDVYSLGCILFEILAGEPLHPRGNAIVSTLGEPTCAPTSRRPERGIAPELDAACIAALAVDATARPTARALSERVQRFLDGDRDREHRRTLAAEHLALARAAASNPSRRAEALRLGGRALALDPECAEAAALVTRLVIEPLPELPPELAARLERVDHETSWHSVKIGAKMILATYIIIPIAFLTGVVDWGLFAMLLSIITALAILAQYMARTGHTNDVLALLVNAVLIVAFSRVIGPYVIVPPLISIIVMTIGQQAKLLSHPWFVIGIGLVSFAIPVVFELTGVFAASTTIADDRVVITSPMFHFDPVGGTILMIASNAFMIIVGGVFTRKIVTERRDAQRQLEIRLWHLDHLAGHHRT